MQFISTEYKSKRPIWLCHPCNGKWCVHITYP